MSQQILLQKLRSALPRNSLRFTATARTIAEPNREAPVVPKFWKQNDVVHPSKFLIDCQKYDMHEGPKLIPELRTEIASKFKSLGVVMLKNTNLGEDLVKMSEWGQVPMGGMMKYEGGANSRGEIAPNVYDVGAPKSAYLHYHHEMAYVSQSVSMLSFCAKSVLKPTPQDPFRGATFLSDNVKVTDDILKTDLGRKLRDLGICYIRCLTDKEAENDPSGVYNHWQTSFMTESPAEVQRLAARKGLQFAWGPERYLRTKCYISAYEYFPQLDRNLLYSSIADHGSWFDTWKGVAELPDIPNFESATPGQKPLKITFGDDSEFTREELEMYADVYDRYGFPLVWEQGDVAVFCNYRFAHGRFGIEEKMGENREIGVVLGPMFDRMGSLEGKW